MLAETDENSSSGPTPCVICMHGNSSCRVEALNYLTVPATQLTHLLDDLLCTKVLLSAGISVFAFDFAGSGKSDGEYVSLVCAHLLLPYLICNASCHTQPPHHPLQGFYERDDLAAVVTMPHFTHSHCDDVLRHEFLELTRGVCEGEPSPSVRHRVHAGPLGTQHGGCDSIDARTSRSVDRRHGDSPASCHLTQQPLLQVVDSSFSELEVLARELVDVSTAPSAVPWMS